MPDVSLVAVWASALLLMVTIPAAMLLVLEQIRRRQSPIERVQELHDEGV